MPKQGKIVLISGGITVLLWLILFPLFLRARENIHSPATGCMSNMKQLGLALVQNSPSNLPKSYTANQLNLSAKSLNPAQTIALVDTRGYDGEEWNIVSPAFLPNIGRELYAHIPRHIFYEHVTGNVNCLFTDGHVKALKPMATLTPVNLWTRDNAPFTGQDLSNAQAVLKQAEDE